MKKLLEAREVDRKYSKIFYQRNVPEAVLQIVA
jgi:hypothetical protein